MDMKRAQEILSQNGFSESEIKKKVAESKQRSINVMNASRDDLLALSKLSSKSNLTKEEINKLTELREKTESGL